MQGVPWQSSEQDSAVTAVGWDSLVAEEPTEGAGCLMQRQFKWEAT